jgi:hypothetical protein
VPELELTVHQCGERAAHDARAVVAEEARREDGERGNDRGEPRHLEQTNGPLRGAEDGACQCEYREDAGRFEVPRVAVRHAPMSDRFRDHGVDALIAAVSKHPNL